MSIRDWLSGRRLDEADFDAEIRSHLAMAEQERVTDGADPEAARRASLKEFGNVALTTEAARHVWHPRWLQSARDVASDIRYACRALTKSPGFSLIVIAVLSVGIGLNAAIFSMVKAVALRPLSGVEGSGQLAVVLQTMGGGRQDSLSYRDYQDLRARNMAFADLTGSSLGVFSLGQGQSSERVFGEYVTGNYFEFLGVDTSRGRPIGPADEVAPGGPPIVVLSDALWRRAFGADPDIVGRTIHLNAHPMTVVGVADADFHGTIVSFDIDVFVPVMMVPRLGLFQLAQVPVTNPLDDRSASMLMVLGRLRPGISLASASAEMASLSEQLAQESPRREVTRRLAVLPIWRSPFGAQTYMLPILTVTAAMGVLLLFIVCANVAGLVLVRGISRRGEIAVRLALGASRARILRLLLVENLVLAVPGAAAGLLLTEWTMPLMWSAAGASAPMRLFLDVSVDGLVVGFSVLVACASGILIGFVPAFRSSRLNLASVMKDDLSPRTATRGRLRASLVVAQIAVSLFLLAGAALVTRSFDAARRTDPGFDARDTISVTLDLLPNQYDESRGRVFYEQLLDAIRSEPGVETASLAMTYPMTLVDGVGQLVAIEGHQVRDDDDMSMLFNIVSPDYFKTLRIRLVSGREFGDTDDHSAPLVAVVNETLARRYWGSASSAIGQRVRLESGAWRTVVGVAQDVKYARINEAPRPYIYMPFLQTYRASMIVHTRGAASTASLLAQTRDRIRTLDPNLPILDAKSLAEQTSAGLGMFQMSAAMLLLVGVAALGLAGMGMYGLVSHAVRQSTHEIGIRIALGAGRSAVVWQFVRRGLRLSVIGAALGIAASLAVTHMLETLLFGVSATDAVSFGVAAVVVVGSALLATLVPAWKAARTNPMVALRQQ